MFKLCTDWKQFAKMHTIPADKPSWCTICSVPFSSPVDCSSVRVCVCVCVMSLLRLSVPLDTSDESMIRPHRLGRTMARMRIERNSSNQSYYYLFGIVSSYIMMILMMMTCTSSFVVILPKNLNMMSRNSNAIRRYCSGRVMIMNNNQQQQRTMRMTRTTPSLFEKINHLSSLTFRKKMITIRNSSSIATNDVNNDNEQTKSISSTWSISGLIKETNRCIARCYKKIDKSSTRYTNALQSDADDVTLIVIEEEMKFLKTRLQELHELLEHVMDVPSTSSVVLPEHIALLAMRLQVNDSLPPLSHQKKEKQPVEQNNSGPRKPYRRYYTENNTEIRVGKAAEDNDELTLNPIHRDGSDWWMHASGCPGSHVVIRTSDNNPDNDVVKDSAALAARQSKCTGNVIKVTMTRCRDIVKPPGVKAGMVQLRGNVKTIVVNMKEVQARLDRLDKTVIIN